jgi:hypothetical protein
MLRERGFLSPLRELFVIAVFVRPIKIRKDDDSWGQSLPLPPLFRISNFEVDVVSVLELLVEVALKSIGPLGVVFDDLLEVVEELSVGIHARNLNVRKCVPYEVSLEEWNGL